MSFFRYLFDNNWMQRADIDNLEERAGELEYRILQSGQSSRNLETDMAHLRRDVSRMMLMLEAIQRTLADKGLCSREDLVQRMQAIDAEDGLVDGKMTLPSSGKAELRYCDSCQHFNPAHLLACQYCGRLFGPKTC
jgi:hypothetical protein